MKPHWLTPAGLHTASAQLPVEGELPSFGGATGWLNSPPLTPADLTGKVVLAGFWTYTCINWLRQLPYLRAWAGKYSGYGLVVIGVHTPEFGFEHDLDNVRRAVQEMKIDYPVAIDNDYAVWRAFDNHYWPALYFADAHGRIRHHHFGEGEYPQSEMVIQQLLAEAGSGGIGRDLVSVDARGAEAPADWASLRSPENYTGYERTENFASPGGAGQASPTSTPPRPNCRLNHWALSGDWTVEDRPPRRTRPAGRSPTGSTPAISTWSWDRQPPGTPVRFRVLLDGQPPGAAHGADVDGQGDGTATGSGCTSSSASPGRSPSARSRSRSSTPAPRPTPSPSARARARLRHPPMAGPIPSPSARPRAGIRHRPGRAGPVPRPLAGRGGR